MEHVTWTIPTHLKQNVDVHLDLVEPFVKQQQQQQQQQQKLQQKLQQQKQQQQQQQRMKQTKPLMTKNIHQSIQEWMTITTYISSGKRHSMIVLLSRMESMVCIKQ